MQQMQTIRERDLFLHFLHESHSYMCACLLSPLVLAKAAVQVLCFQKAHSYVVLDSIVTLESASYRCL